MQIALVPLLTDNYGYLLHDLTSGETGIVDPSEAAPVLAAAHERERRLAAELQRLSTIDALTGLANRRAFDQALDSDFARSAGMTSAVPHPVKGSLRVIANPISIDGQRLEQAACSPLGADNGKYWGKAS